MPDIRANAETLLQQFKGDRYSFGLGALNELGAQTAQLGRKALLIGRFDSDWFAPIHQKAVASLTAAGVSIVGECQGAAPNAPYVDVYRIHAHIVHKQPDVIVCIDGGSGIDATKSSILLAAMGDIEPELEPWFGVGKVSAALKAHKRTLLPMVSVMLAASSSAHLTKYSNITNMATHQKKLVIDEALVPPRSVFDYEVTATQPMSLTQDGAFDGIGHCCEVYFGVPQAQAELCGQIAETGLDLIIRGLLAVSRDPQDLQARLDLGLGTDLGGYAIMVGGTSGPHLNSFSLVDVMAHGRACAMLEPYYTVFFAPAIEDRVRRVGRVYKKHGLIEADLEALHGKELGIAVAGGMMALSRKVGFPTRLKDVPAMTPAHIDRCLAAAKDPDLDSKLKNMPVPLGADTVDRYMGPVLKAAWEGDLSLIQTMT